MQNVVKQGEYSASWHLNRSGGLYFETEFGSITNGIFSFAQGGGVSSIIHAHMIRVALYRGVKHLLTELCSRG